MRSTEPDKCPRCGIPRKRGQPSALPDACHGCLLAALGESSDVCSWTAEATMQSTLPRRLGDYQLIREIARGGMGIVWLARQVSLDREVAVKILPPGLAADPARIARFQTEASLAGRLKHPNIVVIHEIDDHEGIVFYSMDYVPGQDLARLTGGSPLHHRRLVEVVRSVAEALQFAHDRGVLHRDIKPSNILVGEDGEAWITDFGLAKLMDGDGQITRTGEMIGSPAFMAPEQIGAGHGTISARTDVYGLGGLLYFGMSGRAPCLADSVPATLEKVLNSHPVSIRFINPSIPWDLEQITMRCLAKDPKDRYATAEEVARDLESVLLGRTPTGLPVVPTAAPKDPLPAWLRFCLLSLGFPTLLLSAAWITFQAATLREAIRWSAPERIRKLEVGRYVAGMVLADRAIQEGNLSLAVSSLDEMESGRGLRDYRGFEWFLLQGRVQSMRHDVRWTCPSPPLAVDSMDDGACVIVATATHLVVLGTDSRASVFQCPLPGPVSTRQIEIDPVGRRVWIGDAMGLHRVDLGTAVSLTLLQEPVEQVRCSPGGARIAVSTLKPGMDPNRREIVVLGAAKGTSIARFETGADAHLAFQTDDTLEGISPGGERWRWKRDQGVFPIVGGLALSDATAIAMAGDHNRMAQVDDRSVLRVLQVPGGKAEMQEVIPADPDVRLFFSRDGSTLIQLNPDRREVMVRVAPSWRVRATFGEIPGSLTTASFAAGRSSLVIAAQDGTVQCRSWDSSETTLIEPDGLGGAVGAEVLASPDGQWLSVSRGGSPQPKTRVRNLWDPSASVIEMPGRTIAFSPSGGQVLQSQPDGTLELWSLNNAAVDVRFRLNPNPGPMRDRMSDDGSILVSQDSDLRLHVYHLMSGLELRGPVGRIRDFRLSPGGHWLLFLTAGGAGVFDFASGEQAHFMKGAATTMDFSPDSRFVALGREDGCLVVYDVERREVVYETVVQSGGISALTFLADGRTLVTGGKDEALRFWNVPTWRELTRMHLAEPVRWLGSRPGHAALLTGSSSAVRMISVRDAPAPSIKPCRIEGGFWEDPVLTGKRLADRSAGVAYGGISPDRR
jgi:predicted Ser/Thr protein kinase